MNNILEWFTRPETLTFIVLIISSMPKIIQIIKSKGEIDTINEVIEVAKEITLELAGETLNNEDKQKIAIKYIIDKIPSANKIPAEELGKLVNMAYHSYVKPNVKR